MVFVCEVGNLIAGKNLGMWGFWRQKNLLINTFISFTSRSARRWWLSCDFIWFFEIEKVVPFGFWISIISRWIV